MNTNTNMNQLSDYEKSHMDYILSRYSLILICKRLGIKGYSLCTRKELCKLIRNEPIDISSNIVDYFTRYQMKLKCKSLGIKYPSKMKKNDLIQYLKTEINKQNKKFQKDLEKEENIFCYPDIIKEIYSFIDNDIVSRERKDILQSYKDKYDDYHKNNILYRDHYTITIMVSNRDKIRKFSKYNLKLWLRTLKIKYKSKFLKRQLLDLVLYHFDLLHHD